MGMSVLQNAHSIAFAFNMYDYSSTFMLVYLLLTYITISSIRCVYQIIKTLHKHYHFFKACSALFEDESDLKDFFTHITLLRLRLTQYEHAHVFPGHDMSRPDTDDGTSDDASSDAERQVTRYWEISEGRMYPHPYDSEFGESESEDEGGVCLRGVGDEESIDTDTQPAAHSTATNKEQAGNFAEPVCLSVEGSEPPKFPPDWWKCTTHSVCDCQTEGCVREAKRGPELRGGGGGDERDDNTRPWIPSFDEYRAEGNRVKDTKARKKGKEKVMGLVRPDTPPYARPLFRNRSLSEPLPPQPHGRVFFGYLVGWKVLVEIPYGRF
jgi:hypothetical protein